MKSLHKPGMLIMYYMIAFNFLLFLPETVIAQRDKDEEAIINELTINYSNKIEAALKKDLPRYNKMKSEAEEVAKIKDNEGKKKGMDNYANAHKQHYGNKVKEAGVDLKSLLINLEKKFPDYVFTISDDYSVLFEKKEQELASSRNLGYSSPRTPNNFTYASNTDAGFSGATNIYNSAYITSSTIPITFTKSKTIDCAVAAGASVELGTSSVTSTSTGVVAGGCAADGELINSTILPAVATSIMLKLNFSMVANGYAFSVVGSTGASSYLYQTVKVVGQNGFIIVGSISKSIFAPVLWVASFSQSKNFTYNQDLTSYKGKTIKINGSTHTMAMALGCCATNSTAKLSITSASLTVTN